MESIEPEPPSAPEMPSQAKPKRTRGAASIDGKVPRTDPAQRVTIKSETTKKPAESSKEEASRLRREELAHQQELWERRNLIRGGMVVLVGVIVVAMAILGLSSDATRTAWATATLTSVVTSALAYMVGRFQPRSPEK